MLQPILQALVVAAEHPKGLLAGHSEDSKFQVLLLYLQKYLESLSLLLLCGFREYLHKFQLFLALSVQEAERENKYQHHG